MDRKLDWNGQIRVSMARSPFPRVTFRKSYPSDGPLDALPNQHYLVTLPLGPSSVQGFVLEGQLNYVSNGVAKWAGFPRWLLQALVTLRNCGLKHRSCLGRSTYGGGLDCTLIISYLSRGRLLLEPEAVIVFIYEAPHSDFDGLSTSWRYRTFTQTCVTRTRSIHLRVISYFYHQQLKQSPVFPCANFH